MEEKINLLVVEDQAAFSLPLTAELQREFPKAVISLAANLEEARKLLKENIFHGVVTDCGFPTRDDTVREKGNRNGVVLIGEIRRGAFGKENAAIPIAFNSVEMEHEKSEAVRRLGGNTRSFQKGGAYGLKAGTLDSNFTSANIAKPTVQWLAEEVTDIKITKRKLELIEASMKEKPQSGLMYLLGFSSGAYR